MTERRSATESGARFYTTSTMPHELPKAYEPGAIEARWAEYWIREKLFHVETPPPGDGFDFPWAVAAALACALALVALLVASARIRRKPGPATA